MRVSLRVPARAATAAAIVVLVAVAIVSLARGGHEVAVYPSYYPHEIEIATLAPTAAAALLQDGKLHAYIGRLPDGAPDVIRPTDGNRAVDAIRAIESLGSFVMIKVNPASARAPDHPSACAVAASVIAHLDRGQLIVHPYPITPWHGDYLYHADLADAAKARYLAAGTAGAADTSAPVKVRVAGEVVRRALPPGWIADGPDWDAEVSEVGAADLVASAMLAMNGWLGPEWLRTGWFQAELLLNDADEHPSEERQRADAAFRRLASRDYDSLAARVNLERELVTSLTAGCRKVVAGYTVKREYYNAEFSAGIENIASDALTGLHSPMFIRTVKLKDFPWNGWLKLGIDAKPAAAWNPIAGMNDPFGRLMWFALGDPALLPSPYEAGFMLNRIADVWQNEAR
jgi:hypothetical protein